MAAPIRIASDSFSLRASVLPATWLSLSTSIIPVSFFRYFFCFILITHEEPERPRRRPAPGAPRRGPLRPQRRLRLPAHQAGSGTALDGQAKPVPAQAGQGPPCPPARPTA